MTPRVVSEPVSLHDLPATVVEPAGSRNRLAVPRLTAGPVPGQPALSDHRKSARFQADSGSLGTGSPGPPGSRPGASARRSAGVGISGRRRYDLHPGPARVLNGCVEHTRLVAGFPTSEGSPGPRPACPAGERVPKLLSVAWKTKLRELSAARPGGIALRARPQPPRFGSQKTGVAGVKPAGVVSTLRCPGPCATHPLGAPGDTLPKNL